MIYLLLSILATLFLFVIFKFFDQYKINTFQAIIINYVIAFSVGITSSEKAIQFDKLFDYEWLTGAIVLGFLFISVFNIMALTAQRHGLSVTSVASKMSVIIPVIFGVFVYHESTNLIKILGIILALISVFLTSIKPTTLSHTKNRLTLPILLFIGSGIIDTSIKYIETTYVEKNGIPLFTATIFAVAAILGFSILFIQKMNNKTISFSTITILGGIILGFVNYYSVYFLLKALQNDVLESSVVFTLNNVAVVTFSALLGFLLFHEKLYKINIIGIIIAIISIAFITFA